jgi:iron complex outermembrane receptor protein
MDRPMPRLPRRPRQPGPAARTLPLAAAALAALLLRPGPARAQAPDSVPASPAARPASGVTTLPNVTVISSTPLLGSGLDRDKVPQQTSVLTGRDIARDGYPDALRALGETVGGVTLDSASGNQFQPSLLYHGFNASPLQGNAQGIAVYLDGERFNQAFGDTVNFDLIPDVAIDRIEIEGSNPVFGLNAIGGSFGVQTKNGFRSHGGEADLLGGSFGQVEAQLQYGRQDRAGTQALYVAGTVLHQDGWRDLQSSQIDTLFADYGVRTERAEIHVKLTAADNILNGPGTSPVELIAADPAAQFTSPNVLANKYVNLNVSGSYDLDDATSLQAVAYYGYFQQRVVNGNTATNTSCNDGSGLLCSSPGVPSTTRGGATIPNVLTGGPYAQLDDQTTNTNGYGASLQATSTRAALGLPNHLVAGAFYDGAQVEFGATAYLGGLTPDRAYTGAGFGPGSSPGIVIDEPGQNAPVRVATTNSYLGLFASDTIDLTPRLALTASGRFNNAEIDLQDQGGTPGLTGQHSYSRFNPAIGATYRIAPWLNAYAGYFEANRTPTPAELSCASPQAPCSLANFFVGDPNLAQVVSHSVEAGLRGQYAPKAGATIAYDLSLFRTSLDDDIAFINSAALGRAYFSNIGQTRRQGLDATLSYTDPRWFAYASYSHTDATYQSGFTEGSGNNPAASADGTITIRPGSRLPGISANLLKLGATLQATARWTLGATAIVASGANLFGDEANLTPRLPGYATLNLDTTYQLTKRVQLFALARNVTAQRYYTFGTFSPTASVFLSQAPGATNPRAYSIAAPIAGFGGVRVTF